MGMFDDYIYIYREPGSDRELILFNNKENSNKQSNNFFYASGLKGILLLFKIFWRWMEIFFIYAEFIRKYELNCNFSTFIQVVPYW